MPSNHLLLCHPLLLLLSISPSIRVFSSESALHIRWPKYWSFSFSISPSNEYSGMVSCRINWFDLLVVQRTLKEFSPVQQFESINSLALSLLNGITLTSTPEYWKNHSFDYMDLWWQNDASAFNMLSKFVIAFLSRSRCLLISWLQLASSVILESRERKSVTATTFSSSLCHKVMGLDAMILVF